MKKQKPTLEGLRRQEHERQYANYVHAYNLSQNGLILWKALVYCRETGLDIPAPLLDRLIDYGNALLKKAQQKKIQPRHYTKVLQLSCGTREFSAWKQADNWSRIVRALIQMNALVRDPFNYKTKVAAVKCAGIAGVSPATLRKYFSLYVEKPKQAQQREWMDPNAALTSHLIPKKAKAR